MIDEGKFKNEASLSLLFVNANFYVVSFLSKFSEKSINFRYQVSTFNK